MKNLRDRHNEVEKAITRVLNVDLSNNVLEYVERQALIEMKKRLAKTLKRSTVLLS